MRNLAILLGWAALLLAACPVLAQEEGTTPAAEPAPAEEPGKAPVEASAPAAPAPAESEEIIFERLTGLFFEGRGGAFLTMGGARGYSNVQPMFGFEVGYDIFDWWSISFMYASGFQSSNPIKYPEHAPGGVAAGDYCPESTTVEECRKYHLDFSLTFFNLATDFDMVSGQRWALEGRLGGGVVIISPSATPDDAPVDGDVFVGLRFEFYTLLKHFTLAIEVDYFLVVPTLVHALNGGLAVLYTF